MAAAAPEKSLQEESICSVCLDYFQNPVTISCGHNFCRGCIESYWAGPARACPQCRAPSLLPVLKVNTQLASIVASVQQLQKTPCRAQEAEEGDVCEEHDEKLKLFCKDDLKPICVVCDRSAQHRSHTVVPLAEALQEYKTSVQGLLVPLKKNREEHEECISMNREQCAQLEQKFTVQSIKYEKEFEKLQTYLEALKKTLQTTLKTEKENILKNIQEQICKFEDQHSVLQILITETESKSELEFLKDVKNILERCETVTIQKPESDSSEVEKYLDTALHMHSNLKKITQEFRATSRIYLVLDFLFTGVLSKTGLGMNCAVLNGAVTTFCSNQESFPEELQWRTVRSYADTATLDPDTANPWLVLSEDGKSVAYGDTVQDLPKTRERYDAFAFVLGREKLTSERHYWEIDVGRKTSWTLGVCDESRSRKGILKLEPQTGYWVVRLMDKKYQANTCPHTPLTPSVHPRSVGVFLDYEAGVVSFYNVEARCLLFAFPRAAFPQTLRLCLSPSIVDGGRNTGALEILPVTVEE